MKVIFDVVTAYPFEHNFQVRKGDKECIVMPMADFGFEVISDDDFSENFTLDDGEKKPFQQISITVHDEQAKLILAAIKYVYDQKAVTETFTNENHNGNGLYEVVRQWAVQKKLL